MDSRNNIKITSVERAWEYKREEESDNTNKGNTPKSIETHK